jgi:hypothetical protein
LHCAVCVAFAAAVAACGAGGTIVDGFADGTSPDELPVPQPANIAPAFEAGDFGGVPQVLLAGGNVMAAPTVQVVTFNGDGNAPIWETFVEDLIHSTYWQQTAGIYGVGTPTLATAVRATLSVQGSWTSGVLQRGEPSDIEAFLTAQLDGVEPAWGVPTADTLYVLFLPTGAVSCADGTLAWHTALRLPQRQLTVPYVVLPDCGAVGPLAAYDSRTLAASHAIVEAAVDPRLDGYSTFDPNHLHWAQAAHGSGIAGACVATLYGDANFAVRPADLGYLVQRHWSNAAAAAGHDPCVPLPERAPYFAAVPRPTQAVSAPLGISLLDPTVQTTGVQVAAGSSATVPVALFSDGPMPAPWQVNAAEVGPQAQLTLQLSADHGNNGDTLQLHITAKAKASGYSLVRITSVAGSSQHSHYLLVTF